MANNTEQSKQNRPPIVVVLGHVDHGKTTLLDTIRKTTVAAKETGGITQHIGAYQVEVKGKTITFLDTPGHEAFSAIRMRGAKVADIAILVVAADESVKPQTKEAIKIIQQEKMPFIVAINKIDREGANVPKIKQDLAGEEVLVEDWGGTVPVVEISAKNGTNMDALLEMILLVADLEELTEDLSLPAEGVIIESHLDKQRGYVATALLQKGVLSLGDWIVAGSVTGKVKSMDDYTGKPVIIIRPSQPAQIIGWNNAPEIGKPFKTAQTKEEALQLAADSTDLTPLFLFFKSPPTAETKKEYLRIIFKTDVSSSLEAIDAALSHIKSDEVGYSVLTYDIGNISESDVQTAIAGKAQIVGFRVGIDNSAKKLAEKENVSIATFDIIYELIEYVRGAMANILEPEVRKIPSGKLKILAIFKKDGKAQVVGGKVMSGKIIRGALVDIMRANVLVGRAKIGQLQQSKEDATEVSEGLEAGLRLDVMDSKPVEIKVGDILEAYQEERVARSL